MTTKRPRAQLSVIQAAQVFQLLADETRLYILLQLAAHHELAVAAVCQAVGQSQPATSHHLKLLRMGGLVTYRRRGKQNLYTLSSDRVRDLLVDMVKY